MSPCEWIGYIEKGWETAMLQKQLSIHFEQLKIIILNFSIVAKNGVISTVHYSQGTTLSVSPDRQCCTMFWWTANRLCCEVVNVKTNYIICLSDTSDPQMEDCECDRLYSTVTVKPHTLLESSVCIGVWQGVFLVCDRTFTCVCPCACSDVFICQQRRVLLSNLVSLSLVGQKSSLQELLLRHFMPRVIKPEMAF